MARPFSPRPIIYDRQAPSGALTFRLPGGACRKEQTTMSRTNKALSILMLSFLGLWGCAQGPTNSTGQAERVKKLEEKCARLDEEFRLRSIERDDARKQAAALEQEKTQLTKERGRLQKEVDELRLVVKERDRLRQEVEIKTARCEKLKAGLKTLLTEDDAMLTLPPAVTTTTCKAGGDR
jgi:hypothetical protein